MNFNTLSNWNMSPKGIQNMEINPNYGMGSQAYQSLNFQVFGEEIQPMLSAADTQVLNNAIPPKDTGIFSRQGMFGQSGWVTPTIQAATAGVKLWQGMQQLDLAKEQLAFQKDVFARNWTNQVQLTNQRMYDQYAARQSGYGKAAVGKDEFLATEGVN